MPPVSPLPRWRPAQASAAAICAVVVAVQLAVPAARLFRPRQQRFGWQMFSSAPIAPTLIGVRADGGRVTLNPDEYFAFRRGDLAPTFAARLPAHVCRVTPELAFVEFQPASGVRGTRQPCP